MIEQPSENVYTVLYTIHSQVKDKNNFYRDSAGLFELLTGAGWVTGRFWGNNADGHAIYEEVCLTERGRAILDKWRLAFPSGQNPEMLPE